MGDVTIPKTLISLSCKVSRQNRCLGRGHGKRKMDTGMDGLQVVVAGNHAKPVSPTIVGGCLRILDLFVVSVVGTSAYFAYVYSIKGGVDSQ